jgi:histidinol-phosphate aminotransferase
VPGEQPQLPGLVKLNTNEHPFGPSPMAMEAVRAAANDTLRLYPDPQSTRLREVLAAYHGVAPEQVFVGNGSDEVLAHAFAGLLKQPAPLLFPDVTYSFYPVYCRLLGIDHETVPLDGGMRVRIADYRDRGGAIIIANPNAPTGIALSRAEIEQLVRMRDDVPVVIDEAYVDFGADSAVPLIQDHPNLLVVQTLSKSRALAGLRVGYALGDRALIEALGRVKDSFNSYPLGRPAQAGAIAAIRDEAYFPADPIGHHRQSGMADGGADRPWVRGAAVQRQLRLRPPPRPYRPGAGGRIAGAGGAGAAFLRPARVGLHPDHRRVAGGA